jgi:hypothetical protein
MESLRIRITQIPDGLAPKEIREAWVGVELEAIKEEDNPDGIPAEIVDFTTDNIACREPGYLVDVDLGIEALAKLPNGAKAADWFARNTSTQMPFYSFGVNEVEVLPDEGSSVIGYA